MSELTGDLVLELLDGAKSLQLSTINADGSPHLATMWFGLRDGQIVFWTQRASRKGRNMARDPRIACLVEAGTTYGELRGVSIEARAQVVDGRDELLRIGDAIIERNFPDDERPDVPALVDSGRRIGVVVEPVHVATWDFRTTGKAAPSP